MSVSALPGAAAAARFGPRAWGLLLVLCSALFLDALDVSMVGVALPSISSDLDMSTSSLQWVISAYVLGFGGFLLLGGRAADLLGRRRVFLIALGVFVVASALGGLVNDGSLLIATRFVKGVSAAFTAPGRPLDHHHQLRRGAAAQPRPVHLRRHRRDRLLAGPRLRRPADRDRLALGLPAARPDRPDHADRGHPARARLRAAAPARAAASTWPARCR